MPRLTIPRAPCAMVCVVPCVLTADWCLQSDAITNSRRQVFTEEGLTALDEPAVTRYTAVLRPADARVDELSNNATGLPGDSVHRDNRKEDEDEEEGGVKITSFFDSANSFVGSQPHLCGNFDIILNRFFPGSQRYTTHTRRVTCVDLRGCAHTSWVLTGACDPMLLTNSRLQIPSHGAQERGGRGDSGHPRDGHPRR